jgi:uncharacterized protein with HEPN domain
MAEFLSPGSELVRRVVERLLQILGEAARRVSPEFREVHPKIPWSDLIGLKSIISHIYDRVDYPPIYDIATVRIPVLLTILEPLVPAPPKDPDDG